jgi:hypothetical protein
MMALNVGRFASLGVWHVPKYPSIGECRDVQECHTGYGTGVVALLDPFVTPDQNYVSDSAAGGSYERKFD